MSLPKTKQSLATRKPDPLKARIFLAGMPKVGKTTLTSNWAPDTTVLLDLQHGTDLLPGEHYVQHINDWNDFKRACTSLASGGHQFRTVVIDTIDQAYKFADQHAGQQFGKAAAGLVEYGKGTSLAEAEFRSVIGGLLSNRMLGIFFVGHVDRVEDEGKHRFIPKLDKRVRDYVTGECEHILMAEKLGERTVLHTKASARYEAGSRLDLPEPLAMDAHELWHAIRDGIVKLAASSSSDEPAPVTEPQPEPVMAGKETK